MLNHRLKTLLYISALLIGISGTGAAQPLDSDFARAEQAAASGDLLAMEAIYADLVAAHPANERALLGFATANSWLGRHEVARQGFLTVLATQPENLDALTGLAYDYAWGGDTYLAESTFEHALQLAPTNLSARKGLAFTVLWSGRAADAEAQFRKISADHPMDIEAKRGIGQALIAQGRAVAAEEAFTTALAIDPYDSGSWDGVTAAREMPTPFEATVWYGNSVASNNLDVRALQLASWLNNKTRVSFRADDSLSLDNPALARSGTDAQTTFVALQHQFGNRIIGVAEYGQRDLPGGFDQDIYKIESVFLGNRRNWKFGIQSSPHSAGFDESLVFGGVNLALAPRLRLDATLFLAETGAAGDEETRAALFFEYRAPRNWSLGGGFGVGNVSASLPESSGQVLTANLTASISVSRLATTFFQLRWEDGPLSSFSVASLGVTLRPRHR